MQDIRRIQILEGMESTSCRVWYGKLWARHCRYIIHIQKTTLGLGLLGQTREDFQWCPNHHVSPNSGRIVYKRWEKNPTKDPPFWMYISWLRQGHDSENCVDNYAKVQYARHSRWYSIGRLWQVSVIIQTLVHRYERELPGDMVLGAYDKR